MPVDLIKRPRLSARDRLILELEQSWWRYPGAKVTAIRERVGVSEVRYYQLLSALLDRPEALAHDPLTVRRLQRLRDQRIRQRSSRRREVR